MGIKMLKEKDVSHLAKKLIKIIQPSDLITIPGAGSITKIANSLEEELKNADKHIKISLNNISKNINLQNTHGLELVAMLKFLSYLKKKYLLKNF